MSDNREGNEMIKALISKVIDLGTAVKDTGDLIRQLPNQEEALGRWNQQMDTLAAHIGKMELTDYEMRREDLDSVGERLKRQKKIE